MPEYSSKIDLIGRKIECQIFNIQTCDHTMTRNRNVIERKVKVSTKSQIDHIVMRLLKYTSIKGGGIYR